MNNTYPDSCIAPDAKLYRNVFCRNATVGSHAVLGDDAFIAESSIGNFCIVQRRGMVCDSSLDDHSFISYNTVVKRANIGKFCSISWNVSVGGVDHDMNRLTSHPFPFMQRYGIIKQYPPGGGYCSRNDPCDVGNDVWIGSNACILRGVTVSDGAVVGAGAVVTHDIGPYEVWAGVPARKIGQRFSDELISELLELQWWELPPELLEKHAALFRDDELTLEKIRRFREEIRSK